MMYDWRMASTLEPSYHKLTWPRGNPAGRKRTYVREVGAFDIETSTIRDAEGRPHSFMYVWQFAIDDHVYYGRSWDEFRLFLEILNRKIPNGCKLLTYVHNLSYEAQFLMGEFNIQREDIFPVQPRKILKLDLVPWIELRCSYMLTNMDLRRFLSEEGVETQKEEMDYSIVRYPWTYLSREELSYSEADVRGLTEAIRHKAAADGDTWYTIPFTSTGYVRRDARHVLREGRRHDAYVRDSFEVYVMLRRAFRGGNTHSSRYWAAYGPVKIPSDSDDMSSQYPAQICVKQFPSRKFQVLPPEMLAGEEGFRRFQRYKSTGYACLLRLNLVRPRVDESQHVPYIPIDKCESCHGAALDNGRVLHAEDLSIVITDIDYDLIAGMYSWDHATIDWLAYSLYAPLPPCYIDLTRTYFQRKTELKGKDEYMYRLSKAKLNALYGMMAQDPLRMIIDFNEDGVLEERPPEELQEAYKQGVKRAFLPYSWGVWLTAHARSDLQKAIDASGDDFLYCDTDSVKHLRNDVNYSQLLPGDPVEFLDPKGRPHRMGVFERDASYSEFVTLGAKKYAVREEDTGELVITVAGVAKVQGSQELEAAGGVDAFVPGFVFHTGGVDAIYNDHDVDYPITDGRHRMTANRNVSLVDGEYTLGLSSTYAELLEDIRLDRAVIDPYMIRLDRDPAEWYDDLDEGLPLQ